MKRILVSLLILLCFVNVADAALTYGASYYAQNVQNALTGSSNSDPIYLALNEIDTTISGGGGVDSLIFTPGSAPSTASEGEVYYDSASNGLLLYTGSSWVTIDTAGASSLDTAYNTGNTIDVDGSPVTLTTSNTDNNLVLQVTQNDTTNNPVALQVTNTGTGDSLQFVSTGTNDIDGTSSTWQASAAGTITAVGLVSGASDITLENGGVINNTTNNEIEFIENSEEFSFAFSGNTLTLATDTGITTVDWGDLTTASGMTTITGDAADFTVGSTGNAGGEDVIITQSGVGDNQLILQSAGTAANAIAIQASTAGIDIDAVDDLAITNTSNTDADDFLIQQLGANDASLLLSSAGTGGDAISVITSAATGDILINSGDMIDIDAADDILIDLAGAAGEDVVVTNTGGSINLSASEDATDAINIDATAGGIDVDATGEAGQDIVLTNTGGSIGLSASEAVTDAINIDATAGGLDVDAVLSINLTSTEDTVDSIVLQSTVGGIDILCDAASATEDIDIANTGGSVNINSSEAADLAVYLSTSNAAGQIAINSADATADGVEIDSAGGIEIDAAGTAGEDIRIDAAAASVYIEGAEAIADAIELYASNAAGGIDIDAGTGGIAVDITGAADFRLDSSAGSVVLVGAEAAADAITIDAENAAGGIDIDAGTGGIAVDITGAADFRLDSSAGSVYIEGGESANDAVDIRATAGGIDITATSGGSGEDIDITSTGGSVNIIANENVADAITIATTGGGGTTEAIILQNDTGTSVTEGSGAIQLLAGAGGIILESNANLAKSIQLIADGGTTESIYIQADLGTAASATTESDAAIQLAADAGGIGLLSGLNNVDAVRIEANGGTSAVMTLQAVNGTGAAAATESDASIQLFSQAGGIGLRSGLNGANAIRLEADGGGNEIVILHSNQGTGAAAATESDASVQLLSDVGGIGLRSSLNNVNAIRLEADGGTSETINVHANQGNAVTDGAASVQLLSDVGGIGIKATAATSTDAIIINAPAGGINMDAADDINIQLASTGANEDIIIATTGVQDNHILLQSTGTSVNALRLNASGGGIAVDAKDDFILTLTTSAADDDLTLQTTGSDDTHIELLADGTSENAVTITASAGNVDITGSGAAGEDLDITSTSSSMNLTAGEADADAIVVNASAGGVNMDAAASYDIDIDGGQIHLDSKDNAASAIALTANVGSSETIVVTNTQGTGAGAITLTSTAGGITVNSSKMLKLEAPLCLNDVRTIAQDDATPDVSGYSYFNTGTNADTIDDFDGTDIEEGQIIVVVSKAAITYDVDGGALVAGTTDLITASGDISMWIYDGTNWVLISWMDDAVDQNARG
jgi:hypothetical protein